MRHKESRKSKYFDFHDSSVYVDKIQNERSLRHKEREKIKIF